MTLNEIFNVKFTENGDVTYKSTLNPLLDILFMTEYYKRHLNEVTIGDSFKEKLFSMFIRDPRNGMGFRELGRTLMGQSNVPIEEIIMAGRYDDIFAIFKEDTKEFYAALDFLKVEIEAGNELAKKWMPRYSSKNLMLARKIAAYWGMNKQQYGHFIKCTTTESRLSEKKTDEINFSQVPSLAMLKYYKRFSEGEDTKERFAQYLDDVKKGKADLKVTTTNIYDIYRKRNEIDADLFFDKVKKIKGSWIPIVDTSGSMHDDNDSYGKALAVGHYLAKCSTYAPDMVLTFSSVPQLLKLGVENEVTTVCPRHTYKQNLSSCVGTYEKEIESMRTGDCSNTDFGAVMDALSRLDDMPEYLIVLSDMEFDEGSTRSKDWVMDLWRSKGYTTKIIWWNFNSRRTTTPETDRYGNVFMSGYSPMLLEYLVTGANGEDFLNNLLEGYRKKLVEQINK